ncbi:MAG: translesion error-prone DNA polymerase V autoproteolytic subunit [Thermoguttaceae bacterium]|nr:translesion error-prone DNA polymerase V autoproteolytic subunit [Thermoguttaceae bacterium]
MALVERKGFVFPIYLDRIQAGYPSPAEDAPSENLDVAEYLVPNPSSTFFIKVTGESMRDAGIFPGDLLIVDRSLEADNGDVVVALVDGEFTVKRLFKTVNRVELRPENKRFSVIVLEDESELIVWGVVRRVIHNV